MSRLFAVIPAAGHSRRMGKPKLLLPLGEGTVISRLLAGLADPRIAARIVVVRRDDEPLAEAARAAGGEVVQPETDPPDMRASVEAALADIERRFHPDPDDGWLLIPADHPVLNPQVVARLIGAWMRQEASILVPEHAGQKGHPTFFRWNLVAAIPALPADQGLNALVQRHSADVMSVPIDDSSVVTDLDTPADYERLRAEYG